MSYGPVRSAAAEGPRPTRHDWRCGVRNPSAEGLILAREQPQPLRGRHRPFVEVHRQTIASMSSIDDGDPEAGRRLLVQRNVRMATHATSGMDSHARRASSANRGSSASGRRQQQRGDRADHERALHGDFLPHAFRVAADRLIGGGAQAEQIQERRDLAGQERRGEPPQQLR